MAWPRVNPLVAVLAELSLSQMGLVTYLATKEWVDLISGKGSDMLAGGGCRLECLFRVSLLQVQE